MRNNKKIAVLLSACFLIGVLSGCGDKTEQKTDADVTQTEVVTETEEKVLPWAEQNGLSFQESNEFSILAYTTATTLADNAEESSAVECKQQNADYSFTTSVASDENGNDIYTVNVDVAVPFEIKVLGNEEFFPAWEGKDFIIMDYYTGTVLPDQEFNDDISNFDYTADVEWEGKTYSLNYSKVKKPIESSDATWSDDNTVVTFKSLISIVYTITVPHGYDGLVLGIDSKGATSLNLNSEVIDAHIFGEQKDESISDYMFFKVTK